MANDSSIDFAEEPGIEFVPDDQALQAAVQVPQAVTGTLSKVMEAGAPGSEMGRQQAALSRISVVPPMERAPTPPGAEVEGGVSPVQGIARAGGELARTVGQVVNPMTFMPEEAVPKPFVISPEGIRQMTTQEVRARSPLYSPDVPLLPVRGTQLQPGGSDAERQLASLSTLDNIALIAGGAESQVIGMAMLADMAPQAYKAVKDIARSDMDPDQKRDQINSLVMPLAIGLRHMRPEVTPEAEAMRRFAPPPQTMETAEQMQPLPMTGRNIPGTPRGAFPPMPAVAGREVLGPPAPVRPEVPATPPEAERGMSVIEEIRRRNLRTNKAEGGAPVPEVASMGPAGAGGKDPFGNPLGTKYHATPEDWAKWQELQARIEKAKAAKDFNAMPAFGKEVEAIKAKYAGSIPMPPKEPVAPKAAAATLTPDDLQPALLVNGKPVTGGTDHDAIFNASLEKPGITEGETSAIFKAFGDDSKHVFVDKAGNIYTRDQAAKALGEKDPLQSARLRELQQKGAGKRPSSYDDVENLRDLKEKAEQQYEETLKRHRAGDTEASKQLPGLAEKIRSYAVSMQEYFRQHPEEIRSTGDSMDSQGPSPRLPGQKPTPNTPKGLDRALADLPRSEEATRDYGLWQEAGLQATRAEALGQDASQYEAELARLRAKYSGKPAAPAAAPTIPPEGIEGTVIAGKTLAEWEAVKDASELPKGADPKRAELAKWLAVPNQPSRILQALANKKRTREIHGPRVEVAPVAPEAPEAAPPTAKVSVPLMVTREMEQALADLGYSKAQRQAMKPEEAQDIIAKQQRAAAPPAAEPPAEPEAHPIDALLPQVGAKGKGKLSDDGKTYRTPPITKGQYEDLWKMVEDEGLDWTVTGFDKQGSKWIGEFQKKATPLEKQINERQRIIGNIKAAIDMDPSQTEAGNARIAQLQKEIDDLKGGKAAAAPQAEASPVEVAFKQYAETGEIQTVQDLADKLDQLITEGLVDEDLQKAIDKYRDERETDIKEFGGRGDADQYEGEFLDAVKAAITKDKKAIETAAAAPAAPAPVETKAPVPETKPAPAETKVVEQPAKERAKVPPITQKQLDEQFAKYFGKGALPRGPEGTVKITSKTLKTQRENLLGQVDQAIKDAPETGTDKITISVPGDGDFTIFNNKEALKSFRGIAAKEFPSSVEQAKAKIGGTKVSTTKSGKASTLPKVTEPTPAELPKLAGNFVSTDQGRKAIQTVYSDGTQIVATDGRQLIRIVTPDAPGTPAEPVRLDAEGNVDTEATSGTFPNYNQVRPTSLALLKGGASTDELWKIGKQAQAFKSSYGDKAQDAVELFLNPDGTFGGRNVQAGGDQFEHNVQANSISLGSLNADYLTDAMEVARKLGNDKIDLYASDTTGPFSIVGKNHEHLIMPMRSGEGVDVRPDPTSIPRSLSGRAINVRPPEGLGPLTPPESFNSRTVEPQGGKYNVTYEDGVFKVAKHFPKTGAYGSERWSEIASLERAEEKSPNNTAIREALTKGLEREPTKEEVSKIKGAMDEIMADRRERIREGQERLKSAQPSKGPGAAAKAEFAERPPDPEVLGLSAGNPVYNRIERGFRNLFSGLSQLGKRKATKQDFMQWINAADNMPRQAGLEAGNSLRERATVPQQQAVTALMQAFKMSGMGLEPARVAEMEFGGNPTGWLRTVVADMETKAQEFLGKNLKLEAQAAIDMRNAARYALDHFNELRPLAELAKRKFDLQHARLANAGVDVNYENWYVPQRHELDLFSGQDRPVVLGHSRGAGAATGFKKAKTYPNYPEAIENGFIPRSLAIGDLLEHYVATTEKVLTYKGLFNSLGEVTDPVDNNPLATKIPRRVIERPDGTTDIQEHVPLGYVAMEVGPGMRLAIHRGYERLIRALTSSSQLSESAVVGTLQDLAAIEKHMMLALDTFHASRTLQAELALTHAASLPGTERLARGLALVELSPQDLDQAVRNGRITQEIADWIRTPSPVEVGGRQVSLSPRNIFRLGLQSGLNITRFADVMYRDWLREVPVLGTVNRWVFDKMTRSAMSQAFIAEFVRNAKANPGMNAKRVALKTASDINVMFGNLQKESIFRNPSMRAINNIVFLAPQWVESLARREGRFAGQLGETIVRAARGEGVTLGTVGRGIGTGLAFYFLATQLTNLMTRGHLTFQNPEEGHKLDAWLPIGPHGMFVSPLSVFGEVTHDILRFAETKPDYFQVATQIASNKLGNLGRFLEVVATGRDPLSGEKVVGTARRAIKAATQLVPVPITFSGGTRYLLSKAGVMQPPAPGAVPRQLMGSLGVKTEPAPSPGQQIRQKAQRWALSHGGKIQADAERRLKEDFGPSDYSNLRASLNRNDLEGARRAYQELRQAGKTPTTIRQTMEHPHPFTGSAANEAQFQRALTPEEKELYRAAVAERRELARRFHHMLQQTRP